MGCEGLLVVGLLLLGVVHGVEGQGKWRTGSATVFGEQPWYWNIHQGSCGYNYLWQGISTGWDVASIPDSRSDFSGSCGRCYEVACRPAIFRDGLGEKVKRKSACYDPSWSVVVRTTDACPCNHLGKGFDYQRWCCSDNGHLALSIWAFEKLASPDVESIGLKYREVPCDYIPKNPAPPAQAPTPGIPPPPGAVRPTAMQDPKSKEPFFAEVESDWLDKSYAVEPLDTRPGPFDSMAKCARILPGGAVSLGLAEAGHFEDKLLMEAWISTAAGIPPVHVNVAGGKGPCNPVPLSLLTATKQRLGFSKYNIYLGVFENALSDVQTIRAFASKFKGCGGNTPAEVTDITFENNEMESIEFCIDSLKLL